MAGFDASGQDSSSIRETYDVKGFPTMLLFEGGKPKYTYTGAKTADAFVAWLSDPQPPPPPPPPEKVIRHMLLKKASSQYCAQKWSEEEPNVLHLTGPTFNAAITANPSIVVMFYAPWYLVPPHKPLFTHSLPAGAATARA